MASNVGAPWTRLVRGRHELDGDPVIADNGSGQVRQRCRAIIQMMTNERRNEDLWQHDRILRSRNGRKEMARAQKRSDKAAKRLERKEGNTSSGPEVITLEEAAILRS